MPPVPNTAFPPASPLPPPFSSTPHHRPHFQSKLAEAKEKAKRRGQAEAEEEAAKSLSRADKINLLLARLRRDAQRVVTLAELEDALHFVSQPVVACTAVWGGGWLCRRA